MTNYRQSTLLSVLLYQERDSILALVARPSYLQKNMYSFMHCNITNVPRLNQHLAPPNPQLPPTAKSAAGSTTRSTMMTLTSIYPPITQFLPLSQLTLITSPPLDLIPSTNFTILLQSPCLPKNSLPDSKSPSRPRNASIATWENPVYASPCLCLGV